MHWTPQETITLIMLSTRLSQAFLLLALLHLIASLPVRYCHLVTFCTDNMKQNLF